MGFFGGGGPGTTNASDLTTGTVALARGGTGADLSATGGTGQVLKQTTSGGAVSVAAIAAGDLPTHTHTAENITDFASAVTDLLASPLGATEFRDNSGADQLTIAFSETVKRLFKIDANSDLFLQGDQDDSYILGLKNAAGTILGGFYVDSSGKLQLRAHYGVAGVFQLMGGSDDPINFDFSTNNSPAINGVETINGFGISSTFGLNHPGSSLFTRLRAATAVTTSGTQTQGQGALNSNVNRITTNAAPGNVVTLPRLHVSASIGSAEGAPCVIDNATANAVTVWVRSGGSIDGVTDANFSLPAGEVVLLWCTADDVWRKLIQV